MTTRAELDFADPAFYQDPVPAFNRVRSEQPVYWSEAAQSWIISTHEDVVALLNSSDDASSNPFLIEGYEKERPMGSGALAHIMEGAMISNDAPEHMRLRRVSSPLMTPSSMRKNYRDLVDETLRGIFANLPTGDSFDLVERVSVPLPLTVIAALIGFRPEDPQQLNRWALEIAPVLEPDITGVDLASAEHAAEGLVSLMRHTLREESAHAGEYTLLHRLALATKEGILTEGDAVARLTEIVIAGTETTTTIIPAAVEAMHRNPGTWEALVAEPELIRGAAEEFLRYASPAGFAARIAARDITLRGHTIRKGDPLQLAIMAANRDPAVFDRPDDLDIRRDPNPHIAFGGGAHQCLGQHLARLEVTLFLEHATRAWSALSVHSDGVRRRPRIGVWGYAQFSVTAHA